MTKSQLERIAVHYPNPFGWSLWRSPRRIEVHQMSVVPGTTTGAVYRLISHAQLVAVRGLPTLQLVSHCFEHGVCVREGKVVTTRRPYPKKISARWNKAKVL